MRLHLHPCQLAAVLSLRLLLPTDAAPAPDAAQDAFAKLSGSELARRLTDDSSRSRAYYELWRRAEPDKDAGIEKFEDRHYDVSVVVCPQGESEPPLYAVICGFLSREPGAGGYPIRDPKELFPPLPGTTERRRGDSCLLEVFTSDGRRIEPFGGNNVTEGVLADINADGLVERVDVTNWGVEGVSATMVLKVEVVRATARPVFSVLLNWGADEWTWRLSDEDHDGISTIEAGPRTASGLVPKARWQWDRTKKEYVGPAGVPGDHFRVLPAASSADPFTELHRLKAEALVFPADPEAVTPGQPAFAEPPPLPPLPPPPEGPYRYQSLKGAPDDDLVRFMTEGQSEFDREAAAAMKNRLPDNFWKMEPKAAALALLGANRTAAHGADYRLALDDRDHAAPPARCTIALTDSSARCYNAVDAHYFLRVDPDESYLAYARSWSGGVVFFNAVHDQPAFDLRLCPLRYEDARQVAQVIWWLDRARTWRWRSPAAAGFISSTADGSGTIVLRSAEGSPQIVRSDRIWAGRLPERWINDYGPEVFLNFAGWLLTNALTEQLGKTGSQYEPEKSQDILSRRRSAPEYAGGEQQRLTNLSDRFLNWFSPAEERISIAITAEAARLSAAFSLTGSDARLRAIEASLPPPAPPKRTYDEVSAERTQLPLTLEEKDPAKQKELEDRRAALDAEIDDILSNREFISPDHLRHAIRLVRRQLAAAGDPAQLLTWALSGEEGSRSALQRLAQIDRAKYAGALEALVKKAEGTAARELFAELTAVDPAKAKAIARELPADKENPLTVSAGQLLHEAESLSDESTRVATIIRILHNPESGWKERARAIELLVPDDAPLRYADVAIDEALLRLLEPDQADTVINFTAGHACDALARRGRTEHFDRIAQLLGRTEDGHVYHEILGALTHLGQADPARFRDRLIVILKPHLSHTNREMTEILLAIWAADLRELQPELERLATHGTDEFEDKKASSYGGEDTPVNGRFHLARRIISLWVEPDPATRVRLLVSFALLNAGNFIPQPQPERLARLKKELQRAAGELSGEDRNSVTGFLDRMAASPPGKLADWDPELRAKLMTLLRQELRH